MSLQHLVVIAEGPFGDLPGAPAWIEFDSMINVRPGQGNRSRGIDDAAMRERIAQIVDRLVVGAP